MPRSGPTRHAATDRVLEVLRDRVDALGVAEPTLARSGEQRIIVELPGLRDPAEAAEVLGRTAQLTIHPVVGIGDVAGAGQRSLPDEIAIVLDDRVISSPQLDPSIGCGIGIADGSTQISGQFSQKAARELAVLIEGGALPVPVEIIEQRTVGPTLGADAVSASTKAAGIGIVLTPGSCSPSAWRSMRMCWSPSGSGGPSARGPLLHWPPT